MSRQATVWRIILWSVCPFYKCSLQTKRFEKATIALYFSEILILCPFENFMCVSNDSSFVKRDERESVWLILSRIGWTLSSWFALKFYLREKRDTKLDNKSRICRAALERLCSVKSFNGSPWSHKSQVMKIKPLWNTALGKWRWLLSKISNSWCKIFTAFCWALT